MRSPISLFVHLSVLIWIGSAVLGADPAKSQVPSQPYTGEFFFGDDRGENCTLNLNKDGSFSYQLRGCVGIYDKNEGSFTVKNKAIKINRKFIRPKLTDQKYPIYPWAKEFHAVSWSDRLYLVPTEAMIDFCNDVNDGSEPRKDRYGRYYMRQNDWNKPAVGRPNLPKEWAKYLLAQPVNGKITKLVNLQTAWIDLGTDSGMLPGMVLHSKGRNYYSVQIEKAERSKSLVAQITGRDPMKIEDSVSSRE